MTTQQQAHTDWLRERKHGIGGTDVARILGISDYGGAYEVWLDKKHNAPIEQDENADMHAGKILEPIILAEFERRNPDLKRVYECGSVFVRGVLRGTIDAIYETQFGKRIVVDAKAPRYYRAKQWVDDDIPLDYFWQLQHYAFLTGASECVLVAMYNDCREYKEFAYAAIDYTQTAQYLQSWWIDFIVGDNTPTPEHESNDVVVVDGATINATDDITKTIDELRELQTLAKQIEQRTDEQRQVVKDYMNDSTELLDASGELVATWREHSAHILDQKAFKIAHPDLHAMFATERKQRKFLVK